MPRTSNCVPDDQSFSKRGMVVRASGIDSEKFVTDPCNQHSVVTDVT
jgi:hypothetical protein